MDFISDKVNSMTGNALSDIRSRWLQKQNSSSNDETPSSAIGSSTQSGPRSPNRTHLTTTTTTTTTNNSGAPLAGGIPFGGDAHSTRRGGAFPEPPPIGFRTDILNSQSVNSAPWLSPSQHQQQQPTSSPSAQPPAVPPLATSSESLYDGDAWSRLWFQRVLVLCLLRLLLFIRKVYEDFQATKVYNLTNKPGHLLIAATTLLLPTLVFTVYRVSRYLQLALPSLRIKNLTSSSSRDQPKRRSNRPGTSPNDLAKSSASSQRGDSADAQLRRALMTSSPDQLSAGMATPTGGVIEDEGLVTARQTPTNLEEFHDSKSQQDSNIDMATTGADSAATGKPRRPPRRQNGETPIEGNDKTTTGSSANSDTNASREVVGVILGASEQLLHGVLFIFWQLKRHVDVMGYLVERACVWRKPAAREKDELNRMNCHRDGLEWFQDFYAAFLAILVQIYTLGLYWTAREVTEGDSPEEPSEFIKKYTSGTQLNAATSGLPFAADNSGGGGGGGLSSNDHSFSQSARLVSGLFGTQAVSLQGTDVLLVSELFVSAAVVLSLLICVRRRDDGPLTLGLSMIGWGSLFAARVIIIALAFVHIGWHTMLPLVALHVLATTGWIYTIALDSHNNVAGELEDEAKWDEEAATEQQRQRDSLEVIELAAAAAAVAAAVAPTKPSTDEGDGGGGGSPQPATSEEQSPSSPPITQRASHTEQPPTSSWSRLEHAALISQILTLFAIPSLFYWPIMFNLKLHLRPFKYLVLVLIQNFLLITAIWFAISARATATPGQLYLLGAVGASSIVGFIFVSLYVACKPSLTEYFARADELFNEADKSGIYYEFCSRVFKMPDLSKGAFMRLMNQTEEIVDEVVVVDD